MTQSDNSGHIGARAVLADILREGAARLLAKALDNEADEYVQAHTHLQTSRGNRVVMRNGYLPERVIHTGIGPVRIRQPRVVYKGPSRAGRRIRFHSAILPPHVRRAHGLDSLVPWLYLKGMFRGNFAPVLRALLGPQMAELSPANLARLRATWLEQTEKWARGLLHDRTYLKLLADVVYMDGSRGCSDAREQCILVLMGIRTNGRKDLIGLREGQSSSQESWRSLFAEAKSKGLASGLPIAIDEEASQACQPAAIEAYRRVLSTVPTSNKEHEEGQELVAVHAGLGQYKSTRPSLVKKELENARK
jgi:transposase-like protein